MTFIFPIFSNQLRLPQMFNGNEEQEPRSYERHTPNGQESRSKTDDFSKQKIVWGNLNLCANFTIAPRGMFVNAPCPMIVPASKYLLAVLNSKIADFYIRSLGVTRNGGYFEYKPMFIEQLPVPKLTDESEFNDLIGRLYSGENVEEAINKKINNIYGLSIEEINYINNRED